MKRKVAVVVVAIAAIAVFAFFAPVIGGEPAAYVCHPYCPYIDYSSWRSSITFYYFGHGGLLVINPWTNGVLLANPGYHIYW